MSSTELKFTERKVSESRPGPLFLSLFGLAALAGVGIAGCYVPPDRPALGYEDDLLSCSDGRDNDHDGRTDCQDSDCLMAQVCGELRPPDWRPEPENTFDRCNDFIDNDEDGRFDCGDPECQSIMELCCVNEFDNASCSDGIDNDGNGFGDCADFACRNGLFVTVCESEDQCPGGAASCDISERNLRCSDGIDSDGDRLTDCNDPDCDGYDACRDEQDCGNSVDDDRDGRTDCRDNDCWLDPVCFGPENSFDTCTDGFDNDGNRFADCADFSCQAVADPLMQDAIDAYCRSLPQENTLETCSNGVDEDMNGYIDCDDFSCSRSGDPDIEAYCASLPSEDTLEACMDGRDNDMNGFVDCADFGCSRSSNPEILTYCEAFSEATYERCIDGVDNDGNGFTDCGDFSCRFTYFEQLTGTSCATTRDCGDEDLHCVRGSCWRIVSPCIESAVGASGASVQGTDPDGIFSDDDYERVARERCDNAFDGGRDNDADGFAGCVDWDCNYNPYTGDLCHDSADRPLVCR